LTEVISGADAPWVEKPNTDVPLISKWAACPRTQMVDTINELAGLSKKLNQKSDTLNTTITSVNNKLEELGLFVQAWVGSIEEGDPFYHEDDDQNKFPMHLETWLGYYRFERGWELAVKTVTRQETHNYNEEKTIEASTPLPLLNASRDIRAKAMDLIPELLDAIKEKAEKLLKSIDKAEKAAQSLTGIKLGLRKVASFRSGPVASPNDPIFQYAVTGLPEGQEASIANFGRGKQSNWRIMRIIDGVQGKWCGEYETHAQALAALQQEIDLELTLDS
jgi:hypothetical protein